MKPNFTSFLVAVIATVFTLAPIFSFGQPAANPAAPARGFMIFAENAITLNGGDCSGAVAAGGNITANTAFSVAANSSGSYQAIGDNGNTGLYVGGTLAGNSLITPQNASLKIGNMTGLTCQTSANNLEIRRGTTVIARTTNNSNCIQAINMGTLNVSAAFSTMRNTAACMSAQSPNVTITGDAQNPTINCSNNAVNYITMTTTQLNSSLNLSNNADASHLLIINVNCNNSAFTWNSSFRLQNSNTAYTLINFFNAPAINFNNVGGDIRANIFALNSNFTKAASQAIEGQIICTNYTQSAGSVRTTPFAGSFACSLGGTLPVSVSQFTGTFSNAVAHLTWSTASEQDLAAFEVEHSTNGTDFNKIGNVASTGNSNTNKTYRFDAADAIAGLNYYRLKMIDKNNQYRYSSILIINVAVRGTQLTSVYPNPFGDQIKLVIASENATLINVKILDNTGRILNSSQLKFATGTSTTSLNVTGSLTPGIYTLELKTDNNLITKKLIKR